MREHQQQVGLFPVVVGVDQKRSLAQQVAVLFQKQVTDGKQQRMTWVEQRCIVQARFVERAHGLFGKANAAVAFEHRGQVATVAASDAAVSLPNHGGHVRDLVAPCFARVDHPLQGRKRLQKKEAHKMGLQPSRLGLFHLLLHGKKAFDAHRLLRQRIAFQNGAQVPLVQGSFDALAEPGAHFRPVPVANRLDQQVFETFLLEDLPQNIEDTTLQRIGFHLKFFEQPVVDLPFTRLFGHQAPKMAHLLLVDAVDAPKALLQPIGVPRQVVVHHQAGHLQIDTFTGSIGRHQHAHVRVQPELSLQPTTFVARGGAVNGDDRVVAAQHAGDALVQVVQGVAMLRKDDQLAHPATGVVQGRVVLQDA